MNGTSKGQKSLKGFFKAKSLPESDSNSAQGIAVDPATEMPPLPASTPVSVADTEDTAIKHALSLSLTPEVPSSVVSGEAAIWPTVDEAAVEASKQFWGKLFTKPVAPNCEHDEPCKTMLTKKPGVNCGRSFWMCNIPLGPSGNKERGTQWRCSTFIWASDWTGSANG